MFRTLMISALLVVPIALLSMILVGCEQAAEMPQPATQSDTSPPATQAAAPRQSEIDALVQSYLELRRRLAQDKSEGLSEQFAELHQAAQPLTDSENAQVKAQAATIVEQASLENTDLKPA